MACSCPWWPTRADWLRKSWARRATILANGDESALLTESRKFVDADRIYKVDAGNTAAGLITWVANSIFMTTPGGGSTDSSIQRGVDAVPLLPG